jgi:hypothetical protein
MQCSAAYRRPKKPLSAQTESFTEFELACALLRRRAKARKAGFQGTAAFTSKA